MHCERAKGHYDRVNEAIFDILSNEILITREVIEQYAEKHMVCPFEMSLDISNFLDGVICDYNYVFDPYVRLKRYFADGARGDYVFLVDEAHNLGQGRYKERHGETPRADIMLAHLKRVNEIANRYGFTCSMWSDMFFYMAFGDKNYASEEVEIPKEIKEKIPENIKLIYWDYYSLNKNDYAANTIFFVSFLWERIFAA